MFIARINIFKLNPHGIRSGLMTKKSMQEMVEIE